MPAGPVTEWPAGLTLSPGRGARRSRAGRIGFARLGPEPLTRNHAGSRPGPGPLFKLLTGRPSLSHATTPGRPPAGSGLVRVHTGVTERHNDSVARPGPDLAAEHIATVIISSRPVMMPRTASHGLSHAGPDGWPGPGQLSDLNRCPLGTARSRCQ